MVTTREGLENKKTTNPPNQTLSSTKPAQRWLLTWLRVSHQMHSRSVLRRAAGTEKPFVALEVHRELQNSNKELGHWEAA